MNNEEKILQMLSNLTTTVESMQTDINTLTDKVDALDVKVNTLDVKVDSIKNQLTEFEAKTATYNLETTNNFSNLSKDLRFVESATGKNITDIAYLKSIK